MTYRNLMLTMLLGGLWHGAAWTFVLWGGIHGVGLAAERLWISWRGDARVRFPVLRWLLTFHIVCLAWVLFRADSLQTVGALIQQVVNGGGATTVTSEALLAIATGLLIQFIPQGPIAMARDLFARAGPLVQGAVFGLVLFGTGVVVSGQGVAPFIYYRF